MIFIPCTPNGAAFFTQRTRLDGRDYLLTFRWNQRDGHWWLDVADQDGSPITSGRKLVAWWPLLRGVTDSRRPASEIVVMDTQGVFDVDPGFDDLGSRFVLAYDV